jgi:hypothetical protein
LKVASGAVGNGPLPAPFSWADALNQSFELQPGKLKVISATTVKKHKTLQAFVIRDTPITKKTDSEK